MKGRVSIRHALYFIVMLSVCGLSGCAIFEIDKEVAEYEESFGLAGKISGRSSDDAAVIVVLYQTKKSRIVASQYMIADKTNHYSFIVKEGDYYLGAFEDSNNNFMYDSGEHFGLYGRPEPVSIHTSTIETDPTRSTHGLDVGLAAVAEYPDDFPRRITDGSLAVASYKKLGVIKSLDDPVFKQENGSLGYWKPVSFLKTLGIGIYFLEAYEPDKIPILFVHGANGTPVGWGPIVEHLDRERYQPWFYFYPSGGRLDTVADSLNQFVKELHKEYQFNSLYVIAHSMGGLVSRSFILKNRLEDSEEYIEKFISISTPWGGVKSAALGVKNAPGVVPNWYDVSPESEFLQETYSRSLREEVNFHLLFGTRGKCSMMMANNDGTVEIASEIDYRAQSEAVSLHPFDEDHMSILSSDRVMDLLTQLLLK